MIEHEDIATMLIPAVTLSPGSPARLVRGLLECGAVGTKLTSILANNDGYYPREVADKEVRMAIVNVIYGDIIRRLMEVSCGMRDSIKDMPNGLHRQAAMKAVDDIHGVVKDICAIAEPGESR